LQLQKSLRGGTKGDKGKVPKGNPECKGDRNDLSVTGFGKKRKREKEGTGGVRRQGSHRKKRHWAIQKGVSNWPNSKLAFTILKKKGKSKKKLLGCKRTQKRR